MKNLFTFFLTCLFFVNFAVLGQTVVDEKFDSGQFPPTGWTIDAHATNWSAKVSGNAGGSAPEARFSFLAL